MVAVNAVMAGAKPEYFPVILALASYLKLGDEAVIPESRYIRTPRRTAENNDFFPAESGRAFLKDTVDADNSLEILVVGSGTNTYWGGGDFSYIGSCIVYIPSLKNLYDLVGCLFRSG